MENRSVWELCLVNYNLESYVVRMAEKQLTNRQLNTNDQTPWNICEIFIRFMLDRPYMSRKGMSIRPPEVRLPGLLSGITQGGEVYV